MWRDGHLETRYSFVIRLYNDNDSIDILMVFFLNIKRATPSPEGHEEELHLHRREKYTNKTAKGVYSSGIAFWGADLMRNLKKERRHKERETKAVYTFIESRLD